MVDLPTKVWIANEIRIWGTLATAFVGLISFVAVWTHSRWQAELNQQERQIAAENKQKSDERIAAAESAAASANERAAVLTNQAEQARLEYERLRARLAWRRISGDNAVRMADIIRQSGLRPHIFVTTQDPEAAQLRDDMVAILKEAGDPSPYWQVALGGTNFVGLAVVGPNEADKLTIGQALLAAGLQAIDGGGSDILKIVIGARPPPS